MLTQYRIDNIVTYEEKEYVLIQVLDDGEHLLVIEKGSSYPATSVVIPNVLVGNKR